MQILKQIGIEINSLQWKTFSGLKKYDIDVF